MDFFTKFILTCIALISMYEEINSVRRRTNNNQELSRTKSEVRNTNTQEYVSRTKAEWVHQHYPRVGSLFIKTQSGRTLYPGSLNCARNRITLEEFTDNLSISFPSARSSFTYTLVVYKNNFLAEAIGNIKGADLYEGKLTGYVVAELTDIEESDTEQVFYVEILEHEGDKMVPELSYNRNEWNTIWSTWKSDNLMTGSAGKTCFIIVPRNQQTTSFGTFNDITLLFQQFLTT